MSGKRNALQCGVGFVSKLVQRLEVFEEYHALLGGNVDSVTVLWSVDQTTARQLVEVRLPQIEVQVGLIDDVRLFCAVQRHP